MIYTLLFPEAAGIRIVDISVPRWANFGSDVKLECNLELEDDEFEFTEMIFKWQRVFKPHSEFWSKVEVL